MNVMRSRTGLWNDRETIRREDGSIFAVCDTPGLALALCAALATLDEIATGCVPRSPGHRKFSQNLTKPQILGISRAALKNLGLTESQLPLPPLLQSADRDLLKRAREAGL